MYDFNVTGKAKQVFEVHYTDSKAYSFEAAAILSQKFIDADEVHSFCARLGSNRIQQVIVVTDVTSEFV